MKKKMICLIVTGLFVSMLAACGNEDGSGTGNTAGNTTGNIGNNSTAASQNNSSPAAAGTENSAAEGEDFQWTLRPLEKPQMQELELKEKTAEDGSTYEVAVTPFVYDIVQIKEALSGNSFITDRFTLALKRTERGEREPWIAFRSGDLVSGVKQERAAQNIYFQDFYLRLSQDRIEFDNYNTIELHFDDLEKTDTLQEDLVQVISETLGEEYAEYLVYAQDSDGLGEADTSINETSLYELVEKDTAVYYLSRTVLEDKDTVTLYFRIGVEDNLATGYNSNAYGNQTIQLADELKYKPEDVTSEVFASAGLANFDVYAGEFMDLVLFDTDMTMLYLSQITALEADNGITGSEFELQFISSNNDLSYKASPEHKIDYRIWEDEAGIFFIELEAESELGRIEAYQNDEDECLTTLVENAKLQAMMILPELSLEDISYAAIKETGEKSLEKEIEYTLLGVTIKGKIEFELTAGDYYWCTFHIKLSNK